MAQLIGDDGLDTSGLSPLMAAILNKDIDSVEHLARAGADLEDGKVLLSAADDVTMLQALINAGVDINIPNSEGFTTMMVFAKTGITKQMENLIIAKCSLNILNNEGRTALALASYEGNLSCVKLLTDAGADINLSDSLGHTPLMLAVKRRKTKCVKFLSSFENCIDSADNYGQTALMFASRDGKPKCLELLVKARAAIDKENHNGITALMLASENGHYKCVQILVDAKADIDKESGDHETALMLATIHENEKCLRILVDAGADVNKKSNQNTTALMFASMNGYDECVRILVNAKAEVDMGNIQHNTALMFAAENGHDKCVQILVDAKADIDKESGDHETALMLATINEHEECLRILVDAGADVNTKSKKNTTALMFASMNGYDECVRILVYAEADVNMKNNDGGTALIFAAENGHDKCLHILVAFGADMDKETNERDTALMLAAEDGNDKCVRILVDAKANVDKENNQAETAVMLASMNGHDKCVRFLVDAGADVEKESNEHKTALMIASENGHIECVRILVPVLKDINKESNKHETALLFAAVNGHDECVRILVDAKARPDVLDSDGATVLISASIEGYVKCLEILISAYANVNWTDTNRMTTSTHAANEKKAECLQFLVSCNAELTEHHTRITNPQSTDVQNAVNICDAAGGTALMYAVENKHLKCVKLLIQSGADVNKKDNNGRTALIKAAKVGRSDLLDVLINADAKMNTRDEDGNTALMWSVLEKHPECLARLTECPDVVADQENKDGMTPVMWAAQNGDTQCLQILLQFQADVTKKDKNGETALLKAAIKGGIEAFKVLLKINVSSESSDRDSRISHAECVRLILNYMEDQGYSQREKRDDQLRAQVAAASGDKYEEFKKKFWEEYFYVHHIDRETGNEEFSEFSEFSKIFKKPKSGSGSLSEANLKYMVQAATGYSGNVECFQILVGRADSSVYIIDDIKKIFLLWAIIGGHTEFVRFLIERRWLIPQIISNDNDDPHWYIVDDGHSVSRKWKTGPTVAIMCDNAEILKLFIDHTPDIVNYFTRREFPLLILAAQEGSVECFKCLIDNKADVNVKDQKDQTALVILLSSQSIIKNKVNRNSKRKTRDTTMFTVKDRLYDCVESLIDIGFDVNQQNENGLTALMLAVKNKWYDCAKLLVDAGADLSQQDKHGETALTYALRYVWLGGFEELLKKHSDLDTILQKEHTAHTENVRYQHKMFSLRQDERDKLDIIQVCIDTLVNINCCFDTKGNSALILAAKWYGHRAVKLLVKSGANINQQNNDGNTALMLAKDMETVIYLLSVGADRSLINNENETALTIAVKPTIINREKVQALLKVTANKSGMNSTASYLSRSKSLLEIKAIVNHIDGDGNTILMLAASRFMLNTSVYTLLVKAGANVNYVNDKTGETALTLTADRHGNPEGLKLLIDAGANVNYVNDKTGETALTLTAGGDSNPDGLKLLIDAGANVNYVNDKTGETALTLTAGGDSNPDGLKLLIDAGANVNYVNDKTGKTILIIAVNSIRRSSALAVDMEKKLEKLRLLIEAGANVNYVNEKDGDTALTSAFMLWEDDVESLKLLIEAGANVNYVNDKDGETALTLAVIWDAVKSLKLLIEAGANVNYVNDKDGETALTLTVKRENQVESLKLLIEAGANVNYTGDNFDTIALTLCTDHPERPKLLSQNEADVISVNDTRGESVLTLAAANDQSSPEYLELLLRAGADTHYMRRRDGKTALLICLSGYSNDLLAKVKALIGHAADVNVSDSNGKTALMLAAERGYNKCIQLLLEAEANVNLTDSEGRTALMLAAECGYINNIRLLLEAGANVHCTDTNGKPAVMLAAENNHYNCALILHNAELYQNTICLRASPGIDLPFTGYEHENGLFAHLEYLERLYCFKPQPKTAGASTDSTSHKTLDVEYDRTGNDYNTGPLDMKSDVETVSTSHTQDNTRKIAKKCETYFQTRSKLEKLTFSCHSKTWRDMMCKETIHISCNLCFLLEFSKCYGYSHITKICTGHKCSDVLTDMGYSSGKLKAIKCAFGDYDECLHCFVDVIRELSNGLCEDIPTVVEFTTCGSKICEQLGFFLSSGGTGSHILFITTGHFNHIAIDGYHECVQLFSATKTATNGTEKCNSNGLFHAAVHGHDRCVQLYVQKGSHVNVRYDEDATPLIYSAICGNDKCVKEFIKAGCDVNQADKYKMTALMYASWYGYEKCVQLLTQASGHWSRTEKHKKTALNVACHGQDAGPRSTLDEADMNDKTALMYAALNGHDKCVQILLDKGASFDITDKDNVTALMYATGNGHDTCVQFLLDAGATLDQTDKYNTTALCFAASEGHDKCLQLLLDAGATFDNTDDKMTTLMCAAACGNDKCVQLLLNAGATLDEENGSGETALTLAAQNGHDKCIELLIHAGSDPNAHGPKSWNKALLVYTVEHCKNTTTQLLIDKGARVRPLWDELFDIYRQHALASTCISLIVNPPECSRINHSSSQSHVKNIRQILQENLHLCDFFVLPEASQGHVECLKKLHNAGVKITLSECLDKFSERKLVDSDVTTIHSLINVGADVNQDNKEGKTLLMIVSKENFSYGLNTMLTCDKLEINQKDTNGFTALTWAVHKNAVQCVEILLRSGADVDTVTNDGHTCLMIAAQHYDEQCLSHLLQYTCNLDNTSHDGHTALMLAAKEGQWECVSLLTDYRADMDRQNFSGETAIMMAAREGNSECVRYLIDSGCNINLRSTKGFTALMIAAKGGHTFCLEELITHYADLDHVDRDGMTALMFAAETGQVECLQDLLSAKADVNLQNKAGKTAVMIAVDSQQGSCLYHLLTAGADVTLVDKNKKTAFETAIESDNLELVHIFVIGSANVNFINKDGLSPLMIALRSDKLRIARYLMALTFMNMHDLMYRPKPVTDSMLSEEASEFQRILYSQPWPLKKLCFILVSAELGKNPDRENIVELCLDKEPFRFTFMFRERTIIESTSDWCAPFSSLCLHEYFDVLRKTESNIRVTRISETVDSKLLGENKLYETDTKMCGKKEEYQATDIKKMVSQDNNKTDNEEGELEKKDNQTNNIEIKKSEDAEKDFGHFNTDFVTRETVMSAYDDTIISTVNERDCHTKVKDVPTPHISSDTENLGNICTDVRSQDDVVLHVGTEGSQVFKQFSDGSIPSDSQASLGENLQHSNSQNNIHAHNLGLLLFRGVATLANKSTTVSKSGLLTRLEEKGLKLWPVPRDGDCLITATLRQHSTYKDVRGLRDAICDHLLSHLDHYKDFVSVNDVDQFKSKVELLRQPGHWNSDIGDVVPLVISNLLERKIVIYSNNESLPEIIITPVLCHVSGDDLHYVYHDSPGHYDTVVPTAHAIPPVSS